METQNIITHPGVVTGMDGSFIQVKIQAQAACMACHAKNVCSAAEMKEKIFNIPSSGKSYQTGELVNIIIKNSQGNKAVLLAYVIPFVVFAASLILSLKILANEIFAGLLSIGFLTGYYILLSAFRKRLNKTFEIRIEN